MFRLHKFLSLKGGDRFSSSAASCSGGRGGLRRRPLSLFSSPLHHPSLPSCVLLRTKQAIYNSTPLRSCPEYELHHFIATAVLSYVSVNPSQCCLVNNGTDDKSLHSHSLFAFMRGSSLPGDRTRTHPLLFPVLLHCLHFSGGHISKSHQREKTPLIHSHIHDHCASTY